MKKLVSLALALALPFAMLASVDAQTKKTVKPPTKMVKKNKMPKMTGKPFPKMHVTPKSAHISAGPHGAMSKKGPKAKKHS